MLVLESAQMEPPNVVSSMMDEQKNVRYDIYAYRELSREEMVRAIQAYLTSNSGGKARLRERNKRIQIVTVIGAR